MDTNTVYRAKTFDLWGLQGISDKTLEMHFNLYEGYVKETNRLNEQIAGFLKDGRVDQEEMPAYSEIKRRLGFEFNGMVLHEYYFENMTRKGGHEPQLHSLLMPQIEACFGSYARWKEDFTSVGKMRGVGWAICFEDVSNGRLSNHLINLHETGTIAGFRPILVMDVWEHAFLLDYKPSERGQYIESFFANVNWEKIDERLKR